MKKLLILIIAITLSAGLVACNNSDSADSADDRIVGTWTMTEAENEMGQKVAVNEFLKTANIDKAPTLTFSGENKVKATDLSTVLIGTGEWKVDAEKYRITDSKGNSLEAKIVNDKLYMDINNFTMVFSRE